MKIKQIDPEIIEATSKSDQLLNGEPTYPANHDKKLYRPHRGSLSDSMKEVVEIESMDDIKKMFPNSKEIKVEYYAFDARIGWQTYMVKVDGFPNGWTNSDLS